MADVSRFHITCEEEVAVRMVNNPQTGLEMQVAWSGEEQQVLFIPCTGEGTCPICNMSVPKEG